MKTARDYTVRNRYAFGLGTIGRDMVYSLVSMYLVFYLSEVLQVTDGMMLSITGIFFAARIFDAFNDPVMGTIVDNTRTRWGKFKPWIAFGATASGIITVLLFTDFGLTGGAYVGLFAVLYLLWGMTFTTNDIPYWSLMPTLSKDQKEREKLGALARIFANVGLFTVVAGIMPLTALLAGSAGGMKNAFFIFAAGVTVIMWVGQSITLFGVVEPERPDMAQEVTTLKGMVKAIFHNDQLLFTALAMALFSIGYTTTTTFGIYYFKYIFRNEDMYGVFALVLGVSQITALLVFPLFSKKLDRRRMYTLSTVLVVLGYIIFFFAPLEMTYIGLAGILLFIGQAFIQLLMLMFLADTIEYGQWKLHKRNEAVTFAIQPFINKMGGAVASGVVGVTLVMSGINAAATPDDVTDAGKLLMKSAMLVLPLFSIAAGYVLYLKKYRIDTKFYNEMLVELDARAGRGEW